MSKDFKDLHPVSKVVAVALVGVLVVVAAGVALAAVGLVVKAVMWAWS